MKTLKKKISKNNSSLSSWWKITNDVTLCTKIKDLHDQIKCLKNEKLELSDNMHDFENNCLMLFKKGQYWNDIRSAYEDLLCIGSLIVYIIIVQ